MWRFFTWLAVVVIMVVTRLFVMRMCRLTSGWITGTDSLWKETREGSADCISLQWCVRIACGQHAELYRHNDFLFTGQADCHNQVAGNDAVTVYIQVSAAVVGCQSGFTGGVGKLCEAREKGSVDGRRHTDFEEVGQHHWLFGCCQVDTGAYGKYRLVITCITYQ